MPEPVHIGYALNDHVFSTTSELRDALLNSYPGVDYLGAPIVLVNRDDPAPAWGWLPGLLRTRTDWWPAVGIAVQHAAHDGGDHARVALADFLDTYWESIVLLEWTAPIAARWPDAVAGLSGVSFGRPDHRLATIVAAQRTFRDGQAAAQIELEKLGPDGGVLSTRVGDGNALRELLATSAAAGPTSGDHPWEWLTSELLYHPDLRGYVADAAARLLAGDGQEVRATLDWFSEQHDLWRHVATLAGLREARPPWWGDPVDDVPARWRHPIRTFASGADTLGDVVESVFGRALDQNASAPLLDLDPIDDGPPA